MEEFRLYFGLGKDHILDYSNGYDHILFVFSLCAVYAVSDWKRILVLVTAFTIGHSITLALATLQIITINSHLVEFLIPLTILITSVSNLFNKQVKPAPRFAQANYLMALFFGLVHGMGFSNYLKALLGKNHSILSQLFAFNIGLEFGQLVIVTVFMVVSFILVDLIHVNRRDWKMILSSAIAGIALILIKDRIFW
jgi:hypothetical protein